MEIVDEMPETDGRTRYDWGSMQDGKVRLLVKGKDFTCRPKSVRMAALAYAKRRGLRVKIRMIRNEEVYVQFNADELDEIVA